MSYGEIHYSSLNLIEFENTLYTQCLWDWVFYTKSVLFFNNFSSDLHFDAFIIGLCQICLSIGQALREVAIYMLFVDLLMEMLGFGLNRKQVNSLAKIFAWGNWRQEEAMYGALPQLLYLTWRSKSVTKRDILKSS